MDALTAARAQMEISLAFHMVFAAAGIGLPLLMFIAEGLWLRTGREHYLKLAKRWSKATALLFAVGAVSGTALSFELGLLWPRFMEFSGALIGPAFALEGYAFFIEAIFIGLYLYGWDRIPRRWHWWTGLVVAVSGAVSGILVVSANAWMQQPVGFELRAGRPVNIDPVAAFFNPAWASMAIHSTLACYIAVGFAVAGVYAVGMLRGRRDDYHRSALSMAMAMGMLAAVLQPVSGHFLGKGVAHRQPAKLAAAEGLFETRAGAPMVIGGWPDEEARKVRGGLEIPGALSMLAADDPDAVVKGLDQFPRDEWPNVVLCHLSFQVMVASGMTLLLVGFWFWFKRWRKGNEPLKWVAAASPLGFVALEAGWIFTEAGRQPWTVYGIMKTKDAVTTSAEVGLSFVAFTLLYVGLAAGVIGLLRWRSKSNE